MRFSDYEGRKGFRRIVSILTAFLICFLMVAGAGTASAEENSEPVPPESAVSGMEVSEIAESQEEAAPETQEEAVPETQPAPTEPPVSAQDVKDAWASFCEAADPVLKNENPGAFNKVNAAIAESNASYLFEDVLNALNTYVTAAGLREELDTLAAELDDRLAGSDLPEEWKTSSKDAVTASLEALPLDPASGLVEDLSLVEGVLDTTLTDAYLDAVMALKTSIHDYYDILDLYGKVNTQMAALEVRISAEQASGSSLQAFEELKARQTTLNDQLKIYFSLTDATQKELLYGYQKLDEDLAAFPLLAALTNSALVEELKQKDADLNTLIDQLSGKLLFAYIALGLAVLGIIMGIVAAVFALRSAKKEKPLDLSALATKDNVQDLSNKYTHLYQQLGTLQRKIDNMKPESSGNDCPEIRKTLADLNEGVKTLDARVKKLEKEGPLSPPPPPPPPPPIADLELNYQPISPSNSYLYKTSGGSYELYQDKTVKPKVAGTTQMNSLSGWRTTGLLYLFDPVIDGICLNADLDLLPSGYFEVESVVVPAVVVESLANNYILSKRGQIRMRKPE